MMRVVFATISIASIAACAAGPPECPRGEYPRDGVCVPIESDSGIPRGEDGGVLDLGLPEAGPRDAGFPEPIDAAIHDSGYVAPSPSVTAGERGRILLRGAAVLPMDGRNIEAPGEVYVANGLIACAGAPGACDAMSQGATIVETEGVILPGLIDSHNHVAYNWLPEWTPGRFWLDHEDWQSSIEYDAFKAPYAAGVEDAASFCAMVQWGELRALTSGTTTIYGAVATRRCFRWLVRNAELSMGYNGFASGDRMRSNTLGVGSIDPAAAAQLVMDMENGAVTAYMIHVGEGFSDRARNELVDLEDLGLLRPETVLIHGTAFGAAEFSRIAAAGAKMVWSPSSNLALYNVTTDVAAARAAGIEISIAPDWTPSGMDEPLSELRAAKKWLVEHAPGLFSDRELVERVTSVAARVMAIDRDVGSIAPGKHADLLVLGVDPANPYSSVIEARPHEVRLVMIGGVPSYGDPAIMDAMHERPPSCHEIVACNVYRRACWEDTPDGAVSPQSISDRIKSFYEPGPWSLFRCD